MLGFLLVVGVATAQNENGRGFLMPVKMNVFYIGVENPVQLQPCGAALADLEVEATGGTLTNKGEGLYTVKVEATGRCKLSVYLKQGDKRKLMEEQEFRCKPLPSPYAALGGMLRNGKATAEKILGLKSVVPMLESFDFEANFVVKSFSMLVVSNGKTEKAETKGNIYSKEMKAMLEAAKSGDMVIVKDIVVEWPDKSSREISAVVVMVE